MKSKQVLDVQQMQHLQELGLELRKDTILVWARFMLGKTSISDWGIAYNHSKITDNYQTIPAYTLQDVLDALPKEIKYAGERCWLCFEGADERIGYYNEDCNFNREYVYYDVKETFESNIIDSAYRLLCWVIENKFVETNKK